jgi:hypothetical protein
MQATHAVPQRGTNPVHFTINQNEYTRVLAEVVQDVIADASTYRGAAVMPMRNQAGLTIQTVTNEAYGGLTLEHMLGTEPTKVQAGGARVLVYNPGYYREAYQLEEGDILFLRNYNNLNFADRGVQNEMEKIARKAALRVANRMEKLRWDTLLTGIWTFMGQNIDFGIPVGNTLTPAVAWDSPATALPLDDLRTWSHVSLRKYKIERVYMNQKTGNDFLATDQVSALLLAVGGRQSSLVNDINALVQFHIPGHPPIEIYDGWYQDETTPAGVVTVGNPITFVPDDIVYFDIKPMGDNVGDLTVTPNLQNGTVDTPGSGVIWGTEDNTDKLGNPNMEFVSGFNGGPRLFRPQDVFKADVS